MSGELLGILGRGGAEPQGSGVEAKYHELIGTNALELMLLNEARHKLKRQTRTSTQTAGFSSFSSVGSSVEKVSRREIGKGPSHTDADLNEQQGTRGTAIESN